MSCIVSTRQAQFATRKLPSSEDCNVSPLQSAGVFLEPNPVDDLPSRRAYFLIKRVFDLAASAVGLIVLLPVLPLLAVLIKLDSKGPVFFRQNRLGKGGKLFRIYKFRTMVHNAAEIRNPDGSKFVARNDPRLTRLGRFLRDTSLDELPQLLNILKGDMSVVGP